MQRLSLILTAIILMSNGFAQDSKSPHGDSLNIACEDCHNPNGWTLEKGTFIFDHNKLNFQLEGQHMNVDCKSCHSSLVFNAAPPACVSCHADMHQQTVGMDCARCHTPQAWIVPNIEEIHDLSRFPLMGAHRLADCYDCHISSSSPSFLNFNPMGTECIDCHQADYSGAKNPDHVEANYSTDCTECHDLNAFSFSGAGIIHDFFPLTQGHALNDCNACHVPGQPFSNASPSCIGCHQSNYDATTNPNHSLADLSTHCEDCHTTAPGWKPATFTEHDGLFFPIYSGKHNDEWSSCDECHPNASAYSNFTCTNCHEHNQSEMNGEHNEVSGYLYQDQACYECHPTGEGEGFNHASSNFPLTGAHITTDCIECHSDGYAGTSTNCTDCHNNEYLNTSNPNHNSLGLSNDCAQCHTTQPGWSPAGLPNHNDFYTLQGAHATISEQCAECHTGDYSNAPTDCFGCHETDFNQSTDPPHVNSQISTNCEECHSENAWKPATFDHLSLFPIYSGSHQGEWETCSDCHTNPNNYSLFSCVVCHLQGDMNEEHQGVTGYVFEDNACLACHPDGNSNGFDHNQSNFPLTGAHTSVNCQECHINGYAGTPTYCNDCHDNNYLNTTNPNHNTLGLSNDCAICHTTNAGWSPASFPVHDDFYVLEGAHANLANECLECHTSGNYNSTPNTCFGCHDDDYNQTSDPPHATAQFPTTCEDCHSQIAWTPATFNHDSQYFPIYSGEHQGEWDACSDCHTNPNNYSVFSCTVCHLQGEMNDEHQGVSGYVYQSTACYSCHPNGNGGKSKYMNKKF